MKKWLVLICALMMLMHIGSIAEEAVYTIGDWSYTKRADGTAEIVGYTGTSTTVQIPSKVGGLAVRSVKGSAVGWYEGVQSIDIPSSVKSIGDSAFYGCTNLKRVTIPNSVTYIGAYAFYNCPALTKVNIPKGVTVIEPWSFGHCTSLQSITIPNGITAIGEYAFCSCSALTKVVIPGNVSSIGNSAFFGCDNLIDVTISKGVVSIGDEAFFQAMSLTSIHIPDSITSIGARAFGNCYSLTSINLPKNTTKIGADLFHDCSGITITVASDHPTLQIFDNVLFEIPSQRIIHYNGEANLWADFHYIVPDGIQVIDSTAFGWPMLIGDDGLPMYKRYFTIPESVTVIGEETFGPNRDILTVTPGSYAEQYAIDNNIPYVYAVEATPAEDFWTCTCGSLNDYNFCPECGSARPVVEPTCSNCGYDPEGETPNFCPACGTRF